MNSGDLVIAVAGIASGGALMRWALAILLGWKRSVENDIAAGVIVLCLGMILLTAGILAGLTAIGADFTVLRTS